MSHQSGNDCNYQQLRKTFKNLFCPKSMIHGICFGLKVVLLSIDYATIRVFHFISIILINFLHLDQLITFIGLAPQSNNYYYTPLNPVDSKLVANADATMLTCPTIHPDSFIETLRSLLSIITFFFLKWIHTSILQLKLEASVTLEEEDFLKSSTPVFRSALTQQMYEIFEHAQIKTKNPLELLLVASYQTGNTMSKLVTYYRIPGLKSFFQLVVQWNHFLLEYFDFKLPPSDCRLPTFTGTSSSTPTTTEEYPSHDATCWDIFHDAVLKHSEQRCLGQRIKRSDGSYGEYQWLSYQEVETMSIELGSALLKKDVCVLKHYEDELYTNAQQLKCLGMFTKHTSEWVIFQQSCNAFGLTIVPMYETLGDKAISFIANQTEMSCVVVSIELLESFESLLQSMPTVQTIILIRNGVCFEEGLNSSSKLGSRHLTKSTEGSALTTDRVRESLQSKHPTLQFHTFEELVRLGQKERLTPIKVSPDDVQILYYTSGTTGMPKGVIASHRTIITSLKALMLSRFESALFQLGPGDIHASYLPMAHVLGGLVTTLLLSRGAAIANLSNGVKDFHQDLQEIQPTFLVTVPRLLNKLYDSIVGNVQSQSRWFQIIFDYALQAKINNLRQTGSPYHFFWDTLLFNRCRDVLGGRFRFIMTGSAPLDGSIEEKLKVLLCCPIIQAYGLTETLGAAFATRPFERETGHIGWALPFYSFTLEAVPEMNCDPFGEPARGEILIRGPALALGYFRRQDLTKEAFTEDGWFHTGDIGEMRQSNGAMAIIDRKKNLFKLSQGEYVAPEKIEGVYQHASLVSQAFVFGYSTKDCLVAIIVPDRNAVSSWAKKEKIEFKDIDELFQDDRLKNAIVEQMQSAEVKEGLKGFEKVKAIRLSSEAFTLENDLLTPTFKLKRNAAKERFVKEINEMYEVELRTKY